MPTLLSNSKETGPTVSDYKKFYFIFKLENVLVALSNSTIHFSDYTGDKSTKIL